MADSEWGPPAPTSSRVSSEGGGASNRPQKLRVAYLRWGTCLPVPPLHVAYEFLDKIHPNAHFADQAPTLCTMPLAELGTEPTSCLIRVPLT